MNALLFGAACSIALVAFLPFHSPQTSLAAPTTKKKRINRKCVKFSEGIEKETDTPWMQLHNKCRDQRSCELKWELHCYSYDGKAQSHRERETHHNLEPGVRERIDVSIAECSENWAIEQVSWTCSSIR